MFSDDEEVRSNAFYGQGIAGALGFVPVSDLIEVINLGRAAGYWNLLADPESTAGWLMGMREYDKIDNMEFIKEIGGMGNIFLERTWNRTRPAFAHNNPFWSMIRSEFGLYPGTTQFGIETRKTRQRVLKEIGAIKSKPKYKPLHLRSKDTGDLDPETKARAIESLSLLG